MALANALARAEREREQPAALSRLLTIGASPEAIGSACGDDSSRLCGGSKRSSGDTAAAELSMARGDDWRSKCKPIRRIKFTSQEELIPLMMPIAEAGQPVIIEGTNVIDVEAWSDLRHLENLLGSKQVAVKRSPDHRFRYFDMSKNTGEYVFKMPCQEEKQTIGEFLEGSQQILERAGGERMYLQETLCGHGEMADEFGTWKWPLLLHITQACRWGLPDTNVLFVGMQGVETPLHYDERENLFFQVRGRKELVIYPWIDYLRMYPFPSTHPCDRQSMVGSPETPDLRAFPRFAHASGQYALLQAGDLVYLPYGYWHWLRNVDHLAVSVSFWSTMPPTDLSGGVPSTFSEHQRARIRRNLESMVASQFGPKDHNKNMLAIKDAILRKSTQEPALLLVRSLLTAVRMSPEEQDEFMLDIIEGRFGIDWNAYV